MQGSAICNNKVDILYYSDHDTDTNTNSTNNLHQNQRSVPHGIDAHMSPGIRPGGVTNYAFIPSKHRGFLNHFSAKFCFVVPDRAPVAVNSIGKCLEIANVIRETGVPNYTQARIPLASSLNIAGWELELQGYPDQMLI